MLRAFVEYWYVGFLMPRGYRCCSALAIIRLTGDI